MLRTEDEILRKVLTIQLVGRRRKGRPKLPWIDDVSNDGLFGLRNWRVIVIDQDHLRRILQQIKTH